MSLPSSFTTPEDYLEHLLAFLKKHQWIYNYPNTEILNQNVLDSFPRHWINYFSKLNVKQINLVADGIAENCPDDLQEFLDKLNRLTPKLVEVTLEDVQLPRFNRLSAKKAHEISKFAPFIDKICQRDGSVNVIDVGSGLGYLSHLLHSNYQKTVLAIEGCEEKHRIAVDNQKKHHRDSTDKVHHVHHYVTDSNSVFLRGKLEEFTETTWCMVGLHACADLSVNILDYFLTIERVKSLIIMPCCYHRLKLSSQSFLEENFENFPKSSLMKRLFLKYQADKFIRRPFLRNACQHTKTSWLEMDEDGHKLHATNVLLRAIVQSVASELNLTLTRKKRKTGKILKSTLEGNVMQIECYIDNLKTLFSFKHNKTNNSFDGRCCSSSSTFDDVVRDDVDDGCSSNTSDDLLNMDEIKKLIKVKWIKYNGLLYLIEILTSLQISIQSLSENLLLYDRKIYLNENNVRCDAYKITNDAISPRCMALVAFK